MFGDLYSKVSLNTLFKFPTAETVLNMTETELSERISSIFISRSKRWANEKATQLTAAAARDTFKKAPLESHLFSLEMYIKMLLQYQEHLSHLEKKIDALAKEVEEFKIIQSIPGIGEKITATIISEIGEIERFHHPKKLVAFAGVDPSVYSSGKYTATINRITKRGSSTLRHTLYVAVPCADGAQVVKNSKPLMTERENKESHTRSPLSHALDLCAA